MSMSAQTPVAASWRDVSTFQGLILALQEYWAAHGCVILQPLDFGSRRRHLSSRNLLRIDNW